ncbi:MAG TPA: MFS transporter, partial [Microbacterium sp.]|nr:MFS transporter [Microbacterium sp.]
IVGTSLGAAGLLTMGLLPAGLPLWVPAAVMFVVGLGTGCFMSLIFAIAQSAAPRSELGAITAATNLVRQIGATVATAVIGSLIGFGVAAALPRGLDASSLTPDVVHGLSRAMQDDVAGIYHDVFAPVFLGIAAVNVVGIIAAVLLPAGTLSDRLESAETPEPAASSPATEPASA